MRILLDHNVPPELRHEFPEAYTVETAAYRGWEGLNDNELFQAAVQEGFAVVVTLDTSVSDQQNLEDFEIGVVVLDVHPIYPDELRSYIPDVALVLDTAAEERATIRITEDSIEIGR